jgi:hypothetical protein
MKKIETYYYTTGICTIMCIIQLPDELVLEIIAMKNDIVEHEQLQKQWTRSVMTEMRRTVAEDVWSEVDEIYTDYDHELKEWRMNSRDFDPEFMQETVEKLYSLYTENRALLLSEIYDRCRYSSYDCPCSRDHHMRSNLDQMVCNANLKTKIEIYPGWCVCGNCGYDDMVCNMFYTLEHKLLWNKKW